MFLFIVNCLFEDNMKINWLFMTFLFQQKAGGSFNIIVQYVLHGISLASIVETSLKNFVLFKQKMTKLPFIHFTLPL